MPGLRRDPGAWDRAWSRPSPGGGAEVGRRPGRPSSGAYGSGGYMPSRRGPDPAVRAAYEGSLRELGLTPEEISAVDAAKPNARLKLLAALIKKASRRR